MAASTGQINVEALDTVLKSIGTTYNALKALDAQMDATLINKFAKLAQGVNLFGNALRQLDGIADDTIVKSIEKVKKMFLGIEQLNLAAAQTGKLDETPITKFSNALYRFTLALHYAEVADLGNGSTPLKNIVEALQEFAHAFSFTLSAQLVTASDVINGISKTIKDLAKLVPSIQALDALSLGDVESSGLVAWLTSFQKSLAFLKDMKLPTTSLTTLFTTLTSLRNFSVELKGFAFDTAAVSALSEFVRALANTFVQMSQSFSTLGAGGGLFSAKVDVGKQLAFIPDLVKSLITLLQEVKQAPPADATAAALTTVSTFILTIQNFLKETYAYLAAVPPAPGGFFSRIVNNIVESANSIKPIALVASIINLIATSGTIDTAKITAIGDIFKNVTTLMTTVFTIFSQTTSLSFGNFATGFLQNFLSFKLFMGSFLQIFTSLSALMAQANKMPEGVIKALADIIQGFGTSLQGMIAALQLTNSLFTGNLLDSLKNIAVKLIVFRVFVGQIGAVVGSLLKSTGDYSPEQVSAVGSLLKGLGSVFGNLADFFRFISSPKFLPDLSVIEIIKTFVRLGIALSPLAGVLLILKPVFAASKAYDLAAVASFVKAISSILKAVSDLFANSRLIDLSIFQAIKTAISLGQVIAPIKNLISSFSGSIPKGVNLDSLGGYLDAIIKFVTYVAKNLKSGIGEGFEKFKEVLSKVYDAISVPIPRTLINSLKQGANLESYAVGLKALLDVVKSLPSLTKGLNDIGSVSAVSKESLSSLGDLIRDLVKEFKGVSDKDITRISEISSAFNNLTAGASKGGGGTATTVGEKVTGKNGASIEEIRNLAIQIFTLQTAFKGLQAVLSIFSPENVIAGLQKLDAIGRTINESLFKIGASFTQVGQQISGFGNTLLSSGITQITGSAIFDTALQFDKLGSSLEVFGGLTKAQRKDAEDYANVLGKEYPLSANEALKATLDLVKAGQSAESAKSILGPAADLASLSDSGSIQNATSFIIQATSAFKDFNETTKATYENSATAVNIISAAADSSTASVESLAEGLKAVGPVASGFGLSLEETTATLALFTDGGLDGAAAGTQLKSILTNLTTTGAQKELKKLGVALQDQTGHIRPFNDILNDIQKRFTQTGTAVSYVSKQLAGPDADRLKYAQQALAAATRQQYLIGNDLNATGLGKNADKKLKEAQTVADNATSIITQLTGSTGEAEKIVRNIQRTEYANAESLKKIAGSYGQAGLGILLAQGQDGLQKFIDKMDAVAPASVRAQKALDNISGDIIQLQGSVETLETKALAPLLEKFFRPFVQISRFFIDSLLEIDSSVIEFIATAGVLTLALISAVGAFAVIIGAIIEFGGAVATAFAFFATSIPVVVVGFLTSLAGLAVGIAALAASFAILTPVLAVITEGFNTLYKIFSEDLGGAATQAQHFGARIAEALGQVGTAIGQILDFTVQLVSGGGLGSLEDVGKGIGNFFNYLSLSVTKFETSGTGKTLTDIGNLFAGFSKALNFGGGAQQAADDAVGAIDNVNEGFAGKKAREAAKARKNFSKEYAGFILSLVQNNSVLKSILGNNLTSADVQKYLEKAVGYVQTIRSGIGNVFGSFSKAFASAQEVFKSGGLGDAITTFVGELGKNLDKSLGGLSANVLDAIGGLFNINTSDISKVFDTKGFAAGMSVVIQNALKAVGQFLLSNRGGIKSFFTSLFDFFIVGGIQQAANTLRTIGAGPLADVLQGVVDFARGLFGGIFDTIFNVLEGQDLSTALLNAFGPGIQPLLDLIDSLGKAGALIGQTIQLIVESIFGKPSGVPSEPSESFLLVAFRGITNGINDFVTFLNDNVLKYLAVGDIGGMISNLANQLVTFVTGLDLPGKFLDFATAVAGGAAEALKGAFLALGDALDFDAQGFIDTVNLNIKTSIEALGDGASVFDVTLTALRVLLVSGLNGIFTGIGVLLNIDTTDIIAKIDESIGSLADTISNVFLGADGVSIFDNIQTTINNFIDAFTKLFAAFNTSDATSAPANAQAVADPLQILIQILGGVAQTTLDTIADFAKGLDDFFASLASFKPDELIKLTVGLAGFGLGAGIIAAGGILPALATGFTLLKTAVTGLANSFLAKAAAFVVFIEFFRAIAQNITAFTDAIKALIRGDVAGAIGKALQGIINVFVDLGFNLIELLGIDKVAGLTRQQFERVGAIVGALMTNGARVAGDAIKMYIFQPIDDFIHITVPLLLSELERVGTKAAAVLPGNDGAKTQAARLDTIDSTAFGNFNFRLTGLDEQGRTPIEAFIEDVVNKGGDQTIKRLGAEAARDNAQIYGAALADYNWLDTLDAATKDAVKPQVIANMVQLFSTAGVSDEILKQALASGNTGFFQDLVQGMLAQGIKITPEMQSQLANSIATGFNLADGAGATAKIDQLNLAIETLKLNGIDPAELVKVRDGLQAQLDAFLKAGDTPPVDTTVNVDAKVGDVKVTDDDGKIPKAIADAGTTTGTGATGEVPVDFKIKPNFKKLDDLDTAQVVPTAVGQLQTALASDPSGTLSFDASSLTDPKKVENFNVLIQDLTTNIKSLAQELNGIPATETIVTTTLTNIQTAVTTFRDVTVPLFGEVKLAVDPIAGSVQAINNALISLFFTATVGFPAMAASAFVSVSSISFSFFTLSTAANTSLQNVITKVKELANGFRDAATASGQIKLPAGTGGGDGRPPGRAGGGATKPYSTYEVHDTKSPEIYNDGNRSLLLTGNQPGYVTNLADMPSLGSNRSTGYPGRIPQASGPTFNANNITINEGTISITVQVQGGAAATPQKIAAEVKSQVSELQRRLPVQKMSDALRSFHK